MFLSIKLCCCKGNNYSYLFKCLQSQLTLWPKSNQKQKGTGTVLWSTFEFIRSLDGCFFLFFQSDSCCVLFYRRLYYDSVGICRVQRHVTAACCRYTAQTLFLSYLLYFVSSPLIWKRTAASGTTVSQSGEMGITVIWFSENLMVGSWKKRNKRWLKKTKNLFPQECINLSIEEPISIVLLWWKQEVTAGSCPYKPQKKTEERKKRLAIIAGANETSPEAAVAAVLSDLDGILAFRGDQTRALMTFLGGKHVFASLPTGFGKTQRVMGWWRAFSVAPLTNRHPAVADLVNLLWKNSDQRDGWRLLSSHLSSLFLIASFLSKCSQYTLSKMDMQYKLACTQGRWGVL